MKVDGRTLAHTSLETIRIMAVRRVREGERPSAVMASYGLPDGDLSMAARGPQGRRSRVEIASGDGTSLRIDEQANAAGEALDRRQRSAQYGFDFGLWTRRIVADLIKDKYGLSVKI